MPGMILNLRGRRFGRLIIPHNNPAAPGEYLEIFATGQGPWNPPLQSDLLIFSGRQPTTALPVSLTIGGQPAKIVYAGPVGGLSTWSVLQVNAVVPDGLGPGDQRRTDSADEASNRHRTSFPLRHCMAHPIFISYARIASAAEAEALAERLGELAFLDTGAIDDGDEFPARLLDEDLDLAQIGDTFPQLRRKITDRQTAFGAFYSTTNP